MAHFWNALRSEVMSTVDDFRTKGAVGTLRDAVLDAGDMATDAGSWLVDGVKDIFQETSGPLVRAPKVPQGGDVVTVYLGPQEKIQGLVVAVDAVSEPPQVYVQVPDRQPFLATVILETPNDGEVRGGPTPPQCAAAPPAPSPVTQPSAAAGYPPEPPTAGAAAPQGLGENAAWLLGGIKEEWQNTVQDFREKGAVGTLRDAVLDAGDIATDAGSWLVDGVKDIFQEDESGPFVRALKVPQRGDTVTVEVGPREKIDGVVVAVDGVSEPPKVRVQAPQGEPFSATVLVQKPDEGEVTGPAPYEEAPATPSENPQPTAGAASPQGGLGDNAAANAAWLIDGIKEEWQNTVEDFRQKGAAGALKDAALDAGDIVKSAAGTAYTGVQRLLVADELEADTREAQSPTTTAPVAKGSQQQTASVPLPTAPQETARPVPARPSSPVIAPVNPSQVPEGSGPATASSSSSSAAAASAPDRGAVAGVKSPAGAPVSLTPSPNAGTAEEATSSSSSGAAKSSQPDQARVEQPPDAAGSVAEAEVDLQSSGRQASGSSVAAEARAPAREAAENKPKFKAAPPPGSSGQEGRKSIVQIRRQKFENS